MPSGHINDATWRSYLTADDLEREKVLESFGVQMIRLNRFNLGADPVATIDALLRNRLAGMLNGQRPHGLVAELAKRASEIEEGLKSGDYKLCKKTRSGPSAPHVSGHQREIRLPPPLPGLQIERTLRGLPAQDFRRYSRRRW